MDKNQNSQDNNIDCEEQENQKIDICMCLGILLSKS